MTTPAALGERALRHLGVAVVPVAERPSLFEPVPSSAIARDALVMLGVIDANETPSSEDTLLAQRHVNAVQDAMVLQGSVSWGIEAIPIAVSDDYASLAAVRMASSFGKAADPARLPVLEARVRRVAQILRAPEDAERAVLDVHNHLAATGKVRWSSMDIPRPAEAPYVVLAANALAPSFGGKPDPQAGLQAMRSLNQIIGLPSSGERVYAEYY